MATITESVTATNPTQPGWLQFLARIRSIFVPSREESVPANVTEAADLTFFDRVRKFLWLSSGLFSAASFAIPAIGAFVFGSFDGMGTNFLAAIVSACLFGLASLMHFGPDEA